MLIASKADHLLAAQRLSGESFFKLFSQMTREVVRSPGPGIRARSTAIFGLTTVHCTT
jgi:hypothetical protein